MKTKQLPPTTARMVCGIGNGTSWRYGSSGCSRGTRWMWWGQMVAVVVVGGGHGNSKCL